MIKNIFMGHRSSNQNINFRMVLCAFLVLIMLTQSIPVRATTTKTMTVEFEEQLDGINRSKIITIPNLKSITRITTSTGSVNHSISAEKVTINVSNGGISRQIWNDKKESKSVTNYLTSSINSFAPTNQYSDAQGFNGSLNRNGSSYVSSGSYTPAHTKNITVTIDNAGSGTSIREARLDVPGTWRYNSGGYTGTLTRVAYGDASFAGTDKYGDDWYTYSATYSGDVTRPETDTRIYRQDYSGIAYKAGYDNYYKYTVTIEYIDNSEPTLTLTEPSENLYFSKLKVA